MAVRRLTEAEILAGPVTMDVPTAGRAWGMDRNKSYELARSGEFPCDVRPLGGRLVVTKTALLRSLGYEVAPVPGHETAA